MAEKEAKGNETDSNNPELGLSNVLEKNIDEDSCTEPLLPSSSFNQPRKTRSCCCKNSRKWKICGIVSALLVIIGCLFVGFGGIRLFANSAIRSTSLRMNRMSLGRPINSTALYLATDLTITSDSHFVVVLKPTTFHLRFQDPHKKTFRDIGYIHCPRMEIHHGENRIFLQNTTILHVSNVTNWGVFAKKIMQQESVHWQMSGKVDIHTSFFYFPINLRQMDFSKAIIMKGLQGLKQMYIKNVDLTTSTQSKVQAVVDTCLYNPSITTINPIGQLCINVFTFVNADVRIAELKSIGNATLSIMNQDISEPACRVYGTHGFSLLRLRGTILNSGNLTSDLIRKYLSKESTKVIASTCDSNASSISLYNYALTNLKIRTLFPGRKDSLVEQMILKNVLLYPFKDPSLSNHYLGMAIESIAETSSPLGPNSPLFIQQMDLDLNIISDHYGLLGSIISKNATLNTRSLVETMNLTISMNSTMKLFRNGKPFGAFIKKALSSKLLTIRLSGELRIIAAGALGVLHLNGLKINVTSVINGMDNFSNLKIQSFNLSDNVKVVQNGASLNLRAVLFNPSPFSFAGSIGDLRMSMFYMTNALYSEKKKCGTFYIKNMPLTKGKNMLAFNGYFNPPKSFRATDALQQTPVDVSEETNIFLSKYLRNMPSKILVEANISSTPCVWMKEALHKFRFTTIFPGVGKHFNLVSGVKMKELHVKFAKPDKFVQRSQVYIAAFMQANILLPSSLNLSLNIPEIKLNFSMGNSMRQILGSLNTDYENVTYIERGKLSNLHQNGGQLIWKMKHLYPFFMTKTMLIPMENFISDLVLSNKSIKTNLFSTTDNEGAYPIVDNTLLGRFSLSSVPLNTFFVMDGLNSLADCNLKIVSLDILDGNSTTLTLNLSLQMHNPSIVTTEMGALTLQIFYKNVHVVDTQIQYFQLFCCNKKTALTATGYYKPTTHEEKKAGIEFLSNFISGKRTVIDVLGNKDSSPLEILKPTLSQLKLSSEVPSLAELYPKQPSLVVSSVMYSPSILNLKHISVSLLLTNPFKEEVRVIHSDLLLTPCKDQVSLKGNVQPRLKCNKYFADPLARFHPSPFPMIFMPSARSCFSCCEGRDCKTKQDKLCVKPAKELQPQKCPTAEVLSILSFETIAALWNTATTGLLVKAQGTLTVRIGNYTTSISYYQKDLLVTMVTR